MELDLEAKPCEACGYQHDPTEPHRNTLQFMGWWRVHHSGAYPSLRDAAAHCTGQIREAYNAQIDAFEASLDH